MKKIWLCRGISPAAYEMLKKMKLTIFLICITVLGGFAADGYAQTTRLTLDVENATIKSILSKIESQSEFKFFYSSNVDVDQTASVSQKNKKVFDILDELFEGTGIKYEVYGRQIALLEKEENFTFPTETAAQQKVVTGKVTDDGDQPLPGVTIVIKGTTQGTVTNGDGEYTLSGIPENATLLFSFVGMRSQEIVVGTQTSINVQMVVDAIGLEEVVAVGYGIQKKANLTGAVDVISEKQLDNRPVPNVSQLLQGQSSGLSFDINGQRGFQPGAEMSIDIRGIGSINGGQPYVVIDGFPGDMNRLNPKDIESISVLKDAAASAIFGARAPYGVILITTKSGKKLQKLKVNYSGLVSVASGQRFPEPLDSYTTARVFNEAGTNRGGRVYSDELVDRIIAYQKNDIEFLKTFYPETAQYYEVLANANGTYNRLNANANYNWFDEFFGTGTVQKHDFSVSGGSEKSTFYISAGYFGQEGVLKFAPDTYQRFNIIGKIKTSVTDWWDIRYEPRFTKSWRELPTNGNSYQQLFHDIMRKKSTTAKYDQLGNYYSGSSIPGRINGGYDNSENSENTQIFGTELRPLKGWKINADFLLRSDDLYRQTTRLIYNNYLVDGTPVPSANPNTSYARSYHTSNFYWSTNVFSSYEFSLKEKHNFMVLGGMQYEYNKIRALDAQKNNLIVSGVPSLETAIGEIQASEQLNHWATEGYFGRLTYNYRDRYLVESNIRYDGTSRFAEGNRWGFFPSFSAGWNVHNESFWEPVSNVINALKFRGSWGSLGNQNVAAYQDLELIPLQSGALPWILGYGNPRQLGYTKTPSLVSPDLTWETSTTKNFGVNMAFLKGKLQTDFDLFERETSNMIGPSELKPGVLGANVPKTNNATLRTRGWEWIVRWKQDFRNSLSYFLNFNLSDNQSVVTKYFNPTGLLSNWYEGKRVGEIWGFRVDDLYRTQEEVDTYTSEVNLKYIWAGTWKTGDVKYLDTNGDGAVNIGANTLEDHGDLEIIGNSTPRFRFGFTGGFNYKGFDFSMLWNGVLKGDVFFSSGDVAYWGFLVENQSSVFTNHLDYFRDTPGDKYTGLYEGDENINLDAFWPRPYMHVQENYKNRNPSTRYLESLYYMRLQNMQIGYSLPESVLSKIKMENLRIYLSGDNLFTITDMPKPMDPALSNGYLGSRAKTYTGDRVISLGLDITF